MRRRDFIATLGAAGLAAACGPRAPPSLPPGHLSGADLTLGHRLRQKDFPAPSETRRTEVLIVGAGVGGLSAAWKLARSGCDDFALLELESGTGGNTRAGRNDISAYPLGAHYLPLPPPSARAVRELLAELGVLRGDPQALHPQYDEAYLCHAPQERLYIDGTWQEGLWPTHRVPQHERDQYSRFLDQVECLRQKRDRRGRPAFALPMAGSSTDPALQALDSLNFSAWLRQQGYTAPGLHWMADYACRDDYGTSATGTSAWAGLHYFACREAENRLLTAPEGNAWLTRGLAQASQRQTATRALAYRIEERGRDVRCDVFLADEQRSVRWEARYLIWATPLFLLPALLASPPPVWTAALRGIDYAPWIVVNLTLREPLRTRSGSPLAWDNVIHDSPALGYVVATHQAMRYAPGPTVITWYRPLHEAVSATERQRLLSRRREDWAAEALADLSRPHPEITSLALAIDVQRYGHAMIRPAPGRIWLAGGNPFVAGSPRIRFAHADVSGFSIFEEANYRGVKAAEDTLAHMGIAYQTSL